MFMIFYKNIYDIKTPIATLAHIVSRLKTY